MSPIASCSANRSGELGRRRVGVAASGRDETATTPHFCLHSLAPVASRLRLPRIHECVGVIHLPEREQGFGVAGPPPERR